MANITNPPQHLLLFVSLFLLFITIQAVKSASSSSNISTGCIEIERQALLEFKQALEDPSGRLSSWVGETCCQWEGVGCSTRTGNVIRIDLRNSYKFIYPEYIMIGSEVQAYERSSLRGQKISPSLLNLTYLSYLDLSKNNFQGIQIPDFFGSLRKLKYLNLSHASFAGMIPPNLGNLSHLQYLDLFPYSYTNVDAKSLWSSDINWISGLPSLRYLNLGNVNLSLASTNWFQAINMLPSLLELRLPGCDLRSFPQSLPISNFTSLHFLDLSNNNFNSSLPPWLFNITTLVDLNLVNSEIKDSMLSDTWRTICNLQTLDLSFNEITGDIFGSLSKCSNTSLEVLRLRYNRFGGQIPKSLGNFRSLRVLQLSGNSFLGSIPESVARLSFLEELDLFDNKLSGTIPESLGQLSALAYLDLSLNSWEGTISDTHFLTLKHLKCLSLSSINQSLSFNVRQEWVPPFSLQVILIKNCRMSTTFPAWLETQKELVSISLIGVSISGTIPSWLWKQSPKLRWLELQNNHLTGMLPKSLNFSVGAVRVDLSSNLLNGTLPLCSNVQSVSLSNNKFSGPIPQTIGQEMTATSFLEFSSNSLTGNIPSSLNKMKKLATLDLSYNQLSGKIFRRWKGLEGVSIIDFSKNNLSGGIPNSICTLPLLQVLKLSSNNLSGDLSVSLQNCTSLTTLDLRHNKFIGNIPNWIGERLLSVSSLNLRDNMFSGNIPEHICRIPALHILDLAHNNLSGRIPQCLGNLSGFTYLKPYFPAPYVSPYSDESELNVKGRQLEYTKILYLVNIIDLSGNNLEGEIPGEITKLSYLGTLNVSRNQLTGNIPEKIGELKVLETLDLSCNHLSGPIPASMASMTALNYMNLSYNNLSGQIPTTNQFLTFVDPSIYEGNPGLCGRPLPIDCSSSKGGDDDQEEGREEENGIEMMWFYSGLAMGFAVGFWGVCGSLVVKKTWRLAYFRYVDRTKDKVYVMTVVNMAHFWRRLNRKR